MKTWLTEAMRPRSASGDSTRRMTSRMTIETPSTRPAAKSAIIETQKLVERPNTIMATPKSATHTSRMRPAFLRGCQRPAASMAMSAPAEGMVRSAPRPMGPTPRMSVA